MKIKNIHTGEIASSQRWNLNALSEIIVLYPDGMDSDYSKNWVCACHNLPLAEDYDGNGIVICKKSLEAQTEAL